MKDLRRKNRRANDSGVLLWTLHLFGCAIGPGVAVAESIGFFGKGSVADKCAEGGIRHKSCGEGWSSPAVPQPKNRRPTGGYFAGTLTVYGSRSANPSRSSDRNRPFNVRERVADLDLIRGPGSSSVPRFIVRSLSAACERRLRTSATG